MFMDVLKKLYKRYRRMILLTFLISKDLDTHQKNITDSFLSITSVFPSRYVFTADQNKSRFASHKLWRAILKGEAAPEVRTFVAIFPKKLLSLYAEQAQIKFFVPSQIIINSCNKNIKKTLLISKSVLFLSFLFIDLFSPMAHMVVMVVIVTIMMMMVVFLSNMVMMIIFSTMMMVMSTVLMMHARITYSPR